jgi:hypothetical protein
VAWRYLGKDYQYIYFDIPLSFFDRETAKATLRRAVDDLLEYQTPVEETPGDVTLPNAYVLGQNFPNPFNPTTVIRFSLPERTHVTLSIYNILGQRVATIVDEEMLAGTHDIKWDGSTEQGRKASTGIYLYRLKAGDYIEAKKMLLLK